MGMLDDVRSGFQDDPGVLPDGVERLFYKVIYNGERITELVVPYKTEINGEEYTITEASLSYPASYGYAPSIKSLVFPDTVTTITQIFGKFLGNYVVSNYDGSVYKDINLETIVLSRSLDMNLLELGENLGAEHSNHLTSLTLPSSCLLSSREDPIPAWELMVGYFEFTTLKVDGDLAVFSKPFDSENPEAIKNRF